MSWGYVDGLVDRHAFCASPEDNRRNSFPHALSIARFLSTHVKMPEIIMR